MIRRWQAWQFTALSLPTDWLFPTISADRWINQGCGSHTLYNADCTNTHLDCLFAPIIELWKSGESDSCCGRMLSVGFYGNQEWRRQIMDSVVTVVINWHWLSSNNYLYSDDDDGDDDDDSNHRRRRRHHHHHHALFICVTVTGATTFTRSVTLWYPSVIHHDEDN